MTQALLINVRPSKDGHRLVLALKNRGWVKRKVLQGEMKLDERQIRAEAEATDGKVISSDRGYCLMEEATLSEIEHSAGRLMSQGRKMLERGMKILKRSHDRSLCRP